MKAIFFLILAGCGTFASGIISTLFGGWAQPMVVLLVAIALDYVSGVIVALFFHNSPNTEGGGLSSTVGFKGLLRKCVMIFFVAMAYQLDKIIGTQSMIRDAVAIFFIANEAVSLVENAGLMGIPVPKIILTGIEVLKGKADAHVDEVANHSDKPPDETPTIPVLAYEDYDEDESPIAGGEGNE